MDDGEVSAALNFGTGQGYSVRQVISAVEQASGCRVPFKETSRRAGDPPELVADASQAKATLGWEPRLSDLNTIVTTAWKWFDRPDNEAAPVRAGDKPKP